MYKIRAIICCRDAEVMREKQKKKDELAAAKAKDEAGTSKK